MEKKKIKAVILCGGRGTRLREETDYKPKPMVTIGSRPVIWHIMKLFSHFGIKDFIFCLGYKGEMIKDYFLNYEEMNSDFTIQLGSEHRPIFHTNHREKDWQVTLADTGEEAQTGSRVKKIEKYIDGDTFMVTYGDGVADINIKKLLAFHKAHGKIGTVTGVHPSSRFGEIIQKDKRVLRFYEKPQTREDIVNGGFFVFKRKFFDYLEADDNCFLEGKPLEKLVARKQLMVYRHDGFWQCVDTYREYELLNELWKTAKPPWKVWK